MKLFLSTVFVITALSALTVLYFSERNNDVTKISTTKSSDVQRKNYVQNNRLDSIDLSGKEITSSPIIDKSENDITYKKEVSVINAEPATNTSINKIHTPSKTPTLEKKGAIKNSLAEPENKTLTASTNSNLLPTENVAEITTVEAQATSNLSASTSSVPEEKATLRKPRGRYFKFELISPQGESLPGEIHLVDFEQGRDIATFKANEFADVIRPRAKKPVTTVCGIFGYQEIVKYIDYNNPNATEENAQLDENGVWVIPYKLQPLKKGDVSVMYNLAFYKDATSMLPVSQKDLTTLVNMMQENPNYVIKIHAHCNGNYDRKIIVNKERQYFSTKESEEVIGSAKQLTTLRAQNVRSYLADHGIEDNRVRTSAWGGKGMLVNKGSTNSNLNDRIEIEILKD